MDKEDLYKRQEDLKWRQNVDQTLIIHTTIIKVTQDTIAEVRADLNEMDEIISGSAIGNIQGIASHVTEMARMVEKLDRIIRVGDVSKKGLETRVQELEDNTVEKRGRFSEWLKFWGLVITASIGATGIVIEAWPKIHAIFTDDNTSALQRLQSGEQKHSKRKNHRKQAPIPVDEENLTEP